MADFSPTGYWAHYGVKDQTFLIKPVVAFAPDANGVHRAMVVDHKGGRLVRADQLMDTFLAVLPRGK